MANGELGDTAEKVSSFISAVLLKHLYRDMQDVLNMRNMYRTSDSCVGFCSNKPGRVLERSINGRRRHVVLHSAPAWCALMRVVDY